ncbi:FAD-binding oxidoreductase [Paractinoplanes atraurantiacus]|uniref:FAD/FMN-containing dehydrogenase n=1 Tax=Paractinoplanes atraurantiacus TaxID=1036182 RepID=A0A285JV08_9ACTN|nr:FAD-binding oxidoreductase [Actinoplanes atraurantiacus]SNY64164.1 FAD/FMN-containing dehydrogenase [Actinoplanes atraurantiacus]
MTAAQSFGEATLGELAQALRGELVRPGDPEYDEARAVWNGAHDRRPALIIRCHGVADVLKAVEFARSEGLPLAVRGGAHSIPGFSTVDDGLVIDLSAMKGIRVDPGRRTVVAQGGSLWSDVDAETQAFGLALTGGLVSSTGIGGFTLGGGIGWLVRRCGLTCDNLVAADVVTADGRYLHVSEDEHPELLWALRGGGGNFGVVTSFEFRLYDVGPAIFGGLVFYRGEDAERVLRGYREATRGAPDELTTLVNLTTAPPAPFLPAEIHGKPITAVGGMWSGRPEDGDAATRPFRELAPVVTDLFGPMPYTAMQGLLDPLYPRGMWNYFRSAFFGDLDASAISALTDAYARVPNPISEVHVHHLGGAMGRVPAEATAFASRDRDFILNVVARSADAGGYPAAVEWARTATGALGPDSATYVNFTGEGGEDRVRAAYPKDTYERLVAVKDRYDPTNLFRLNQNIRPSQAH